MTLSKAPRWPVRAGVRALAVRCAAAAAAAALWSCGGSDADRQPPVAALTTPANLASDLSDTVTLSASAGDNVAVAGVEFQVDGVTVGSEVQAAPYTVAIDTTLWPSGQHVVRARARDTSGHLSPWATAVVHFGGSRDVPAGFTKNDTWVVGLDNATAFVSAPDGRLFVAEQSGALRVVKNGVLLATPFLTRTVDSIGERGLIGVALHPEFASNGWVYVYYTRPNATAQNNRVSRFTANGDVATGAEVVLFDLPDTQASNHNGGAIGFGPDGKLYVAVGDDARRSEVQDRSSPFGKILRFNDDGSIPTDNPFFATQTGLGRAVWAYGLRNPYTFAFQPGSGRMHINDVGELTWEEVNLGAPGANYGWPGSEGPENLAAGVTAPLLVYNHNDSNPLGSGPGGFLRGSAVVGGAFYPAGGPFPAPWRGNYFFADYGYSFIGLLDIANGNAAYTFGSVVGNPVGLRVSDDGALYVLTRSAITRITAP